MDTSAIAKRYISEVGSKWISQLAHPTSGNVILISDLTTIEVASAINRSSLAGFASATTNNIALNNFLLDVGNQYIRYPIDERVQHIARSIIIQHRLRTLDAIQLASAIEASQYFGVSMTFLSADTRLLAAAAAEGFAIDDPNRHP
jgi:predicted nucleic acid-binding protein